MKREQRLRSPADFRRVRDVATRGWPNRLLVLHAAPNELGRARVGITVSGRVGNAVVRNKVRRRLREALRARYPGLVPGKDLVIAARPASASVSFQELCQALDALLARAGALRA